MKTITMMSEADMTKGHGVLSVYDELMMLLETYYPDKYIVRKNSLAHADIFHYHTINPEFFLSIPLVRKKSITVGFVHFMPKTLDESLDLWKVAKVPFYKYIIKFYNSMDYLVTVNPHFIEELVEAGIDRNKITYIPNCVSSEHFFEMSAQEKGQLRKKLDIPLDKRVIIGVGQLQIRKGVLDFVKVAKDNPDKLFLWLGGFSFGKISDGYDEIKEIMEHPPANVRFVGMVDRSEMNDYYNASDLLLLPSYAELFPMTILEALNCKLPIVVRNLEEYQGIVSDYCLLCEDAEGFSREINRLCSDEAYYAQAKVKSTAGSEFYSTENVAKMWDQFYSSLTKKVRNKKLSCGKSGVAR